TAVGWLYTVRAGGLPGPRVAEALPLDELAKHSSAPLPWFAAVWIVAGCLLGLAARWARLPRLVASFSLAVGVGLTVYLTTGISLAVTRQVPARVALHVAERLGAVYLPAALVGLAVALIARPRTEGRSSPAIVAVVVAAAGGFELLPAVLPGTNDGVLRALTPDAVGPLSHAACVFAGVALLFASRGLARRRRRAWQLAVAVSALSTLLHVLHGINHGTLVSTLVLILLVARRNDFVLPGDVQTRFLFATRAGVAAAAIFAFGCIALWINRLDA